MQIFQKMWSLNNVAEVIEIDAQLQLLAERSRRTREQRNLVRRRIESLMQSREQLISITDAERRLREYMGN